MSTQQVDCALLVLSSDRYADLWPIFFDQLVRHWSACPFPVYLGSNTATLEDRPWVRTILSGPDRDWSSSLREILRQIPHRYVLLTHEDFIIVEDVDTARVEDCLEYVRTNGIRHVQLRSHLPCDGMTHQRYGIIAKGAPYRVNTMGIWEKSSLVALLLDGESAWNFEIMGSYRSSSMEGFVRDLASPIRIINLVEKGCYIPESVRRLERQGIMVGPGERRLLTGSWKLRSWLQRIWFDAMIHVPWRWRVRAMNVLRKLLVSY